ncbi:uncharacterized protein [Asterias amurensis]|uniref:uncharacterized protein n=1 Tax=Asterias amurensis TaxID=7602 RepID=UPI003AB79607
MASIMLVLLGVLILKSSSESACVCDNSTATEGYNFTECEQEGQISGFTCSYAQHKSSKASCCCECPEGTFMAKRNTCEYCRNHTKCDPNQELESNGTLAEDRKCKCRQYPISYEECKKVNCTVFPADITTQRPDATSSTKPDRSTEPHMSTKKPDPFIGAEVCCGTVCDVVIGLLLVIILILILIIVILCHRPKWCCFGKKKDFTVSSTSNSTTASPGHVLSSPPESTEPEQAPLSPQDTLL